MTLTLLVAILVSMLAGFFCTVGFWTRQVPTAPVLVLSASLAVGLGFGLSSPSRFSARLRTDSSSLMSYCCCS